MPDELDKKLIVLLQNDLPLTSHPYRAMAEKIGISEEEVLQRMEKLMNRGILRSVKVVVKHRQVGYAANALCVMNVPVGQLDTVGKIMAACPAATHCYSRAARPGWNYNLYVMLHAATREECEKIAFRWTQLCSIVDYTLLYTVKEWKKDTMRYFSGGDVPC